MPKVLITNDIKIAFQLLIVDIKHVRSSRTLLEGSYAIRFVKE